MEKSQKRSCPNNNEANRRVRFNLQNTSYSQDQFQSSNSGNGPACPQNTGQTLQSSNNDTAVAYSHNAGPMFRSFNNDTGVAHPQNARPTFQSLNNNTRVSYPPNSRPMSKSFNNGSGASNPPKKELTSRSFNNGSGASNPSKEELTSRNFNNGSGASNPPKEELTSRSFNNDNGTSDPPKEELTRHLYKLGLKDLMQNAQAPPTLLVLRETTISSIRDTLNARYERPKESEPPNILPADSFPATVLRIGEYKFTAKDEGTLIAGFYYAKKKLSWEIFDKDNRIKNKIEVLWQDISGMRAIIEENMPGILKVELTKPPTFFHHIDPQPRSHPQWNSSDDFTGGHALTCRIHYLEFLPGVLDGFYKKLMQSDKRLLELNQLPVPRPGRPFLSSGPLFDQGATATATNSSHAHNACSSQTNPSSHEHTTLPISAQQTGQTHNATSSSSLMHSTLPTLVADIPSHNVSLFNNPMLTAETESQEHAFQQKTMDQRLPNSYLNAMLMSCPSEEEIQSCKVNTQNIGDNTLLAGPSSEIYMGNLQQPSSGLHHQYNGDMGNLQQPSSELHHPYNGDMGNPHQPSSELHHPYNGDMGNLQQPSSGLHYQYNGDMGNLQQPSSELHHQYNGDMGNLHQPSSELHHPYNGDMGNPHQPSSELHHPYNGDMGNLHQPSSELHHQYNGDMGNLPQPSIELHHQYNGDMGNLHQPSIGWHQIYSFDFGRPSANIQQPSGQLDKGNPDVLR